MQVKQITTIERDSAVISLFTDAAAVDKSLNEKLGQLAQHLADQVIDLELPHVSKLALIEATYKAEFTALALNRNTVATLRALLVCKVADDFEVEVKAPSKDGKVAAVFKKSADLTAGEAKKFAAEVKAEAAALDLSPEAKAEAEAAAKKAADEARAKATAETAVLLAKKADEAFAFVLSTTQRQRLVSQLAEIGFKLVKSVAKPE